MKIIFIADFFANQVPGGGELNNEEVISILSSFGNEVVKRTSSMATKSFIEENSGNKFIVANFALLSEDVKMQLQKEKYIIYEHDHKYLKNRNPAFYKDYIAPKSEIINEDFYRNALAVLCQSRFHKNIIEKNLDIQNVISLSGNAWSDEILTYISSLLTNEKIYENAIMDSGIQHKNTADALLYSKIKNQPYHLIPHKKYKDFLEEMSKCKRLIFFPKTPETLSRIAVEARMMNMTVVTNENLGASYEDWFSFKGQELIKFMKNKKLEIVNTILELFS